MQVDCVKDGVSALEQFGKGCRDGKSYDLAILDKQMSGMDGLELAHRIKADSTVASVKLVLLTYFNQRPDKGEVERAGIAATLCKPVRQSQLYNCLATLMGVSVETQLVNDRSLEPKAQWDIRALVAEDNVVNQKVAALMLEKLGCRVDIAANGLEVLEAVDRLPYDVIFMDCQMPEMDGYEATRAIRKKEDLKNSEITTLNSQQSHTPIIAMTASALRGDRQTCLDAGMDDYLSKPVKSEALIAMLQKWMRSSPEEPYQPVPSVSPEPRIEERN